jgi:hypothetical protein
MDNCIVDPKTGNLNMPFDAKQAAIEQLRQLLAMAENDELLCVEISRPEEELPIGVFQKIYKPGRKICVTYTLTKDV